VHQGGEGTRRRERRSAELPQRAPRHTALAPRFVAGLEALGAPGLGDPHPPMADLLPPRWPSAGCSCASIHMLDLKCPEIVVASRDVSSSAAFSSVVARAPLVVTHATVGLAGKIGSGRRPRRRHCSTRRAPGSSARAVIAASAALGDSSRAGARPKDPCRNAAPVVPLLRRPNTGVSRIERGFPKTVAGVQVRPGVASEGQASRRGPRACSLLAFPPCLAAVRTPVPGPSEGHLPREILDVLRTPSRGSQGPTSSGPGARTASGGQAGLRLRRRHNAAPSRCSGSFAASAPRHQHGRSPS
jgi:hypothetical protein